MRSAGRGPAQLGLRRAAWGRAGLLLWEGLISAAALCVGVAGPLDVAFPSPGFHGAGLPRSFLWMLPCDALALVDIIGVSLLLRKGHKNGPRAYATRRLLPDVLGLMVPDVVDWQVGGATAALSAAAALKAARLARVVFRMSRLGRSGGPPWNPWKGPAAPAAAFVSFAWLAHWVACGWVTVLRLEAQPGGGWLGEMGIDAPSYADEASGTLEFLPAERSRAYPLALRWAASTLLLGPDSAAPSSSAEAVVSAAVLLLGFTALAALARAVLLVGPGGYPFVPREDADEARPRKGQLSDGSGVGDGGLGAEAERQLVRLREELERAVRERNFMAEEVKMARSALQEADAVRREETASLKLAMSKMSEAHLEALQDGRANGATLSTIQDTLQDLARTIQESDLDQILNIEVRLQQISMDQEDTLEYMKALADAALQDSENSP